MNGFVNKVILVGTLTKDPEIKQTQSGDNLAILFLMVNDSWENRRTQKKTVKTDYFKIVIFSNNLIQLAMNELKIGNQLYVEGLLRVRKWQDEQKNNCYSTEIVLFSHNGVLILLNNNNNNNNTDFIT